jgi:hypothetical protein
MEDTYEIGVRLVLDNGVSAGMAALRDDLAAYDRAVSATTGRLRAVREVGRELMAPVRVPEMAAVPHSATAGEATNTMDGERAGKRNAPLSMPPVPHAVAPPSRESVIPATEPKPVGPAEPVAWRSGLAPIRAVAPQRLPEAAGQTNVTEARPLPVAEPRGRRADYAAHAPALLAKPAPPPAQSGAGPGRRALASTAVGSEAPWTPQTERMADRVPATTQLQAQANPAAPGAPGLLPTPASAPPAAAAATEATNAMPPAPEQGNLYLDGARIGRWMIDHLTREVDRPQTGIAGFDPRLSPTWPGSLHGT